MADLNGILQSLFDSTNNALRVSSASAGITYATPAFTLSTSNAAGAATTLVRSDAQLALFDATAPITQAYSDVAAVGTAAFAARRDHKHGIPKNIHFKYIKKTTADYSLNNASFTAIDSSNLDIVLAGAVGDVIEYSLKGVSGTENITIIFDIATIVSAAIVNTFAGSGSTPQEGWYVGAETVSRMVSGAAYYTLQAGDISGGNVTLRPYFKTFGGAKTLKASSGDPLFLSAKNLGPTD